MSKAPGASGLRPGVLDIYSFGRKLLKINDLDPVYVLLQQSDFPRTKLVRWLLAYWCFYHVGTASWITWYGAGKDTDKKYWNAMNTAAGSKDWPRSSERRHFRGDAAKQAVSWLAKQGIEELFDPLLEPRRYTFQEVTSYVQTWKLFGPWISFKVADMLERLNVTQVVFNTEDVFLFDSPKQGAHMLWALEGSPNPRDPVTDKGDVYSWAVNRILTTLNPINAPPRYERVLNVQEAETILCKWHSYARGHYHIGEDVEACRKGLLRFPKCGLCQVLIRAGRKGSLWS